MRYLHKQVTDTNIEGVKTLLSHCVDTKILTNEYDTSISNLQQMRVFSFGEQYPSEENRFLNEDSIAEMIENKTGRRGLTPAAIACAKGNMEMIKLLLENGADLRLHCRVFDNPKGNRLPLHFAAKHGHLHVMKYILDDMKLQVDEMDFLLALGLASANGHLDIVKYLVEEKNIKTESLKRFPVYNPIYLSAKRAHLDIFKYLLARFPEEIRSEVLNFSLLSVLVKPDMPFPHKPRYKGFFDRVLSVLHYLFENHKELVDINFCTKSKQHMPIASAVKNDNVKAVEYLLLQKVNASVYDRHGRNTLHIAAMRGNMEIAEMLVEYGVDIESKVTNSNQTAIDLVPAEKVEKLKSIFEIYRKKQAVRKAAQTTGKKTQERGLLCDLSIVTFDREVKKAEPPKVLGKRKQDEEGEEKQAKKQRIK